MHIRVRDVPPLFRAFCALFFVVLRASLWVRSLLSFLFAFRALPALFFALFCLVSVVPSGALRTSFFLFDGLPGPKAWGPVTSDAERLEI